jgi:hydroxymethylglutaryl-CoA lyase
MDRVILEDQTLRDGLQNETRLFSLEEKIQIVEMLLRAGVTRVQLGSFVHPGRVPQMADTDELVRLVGRRPGIIFTGLVLNDKGLERALAGGLDHLTISASVSNTHSLRNANRPAAQALDDMTRLIGEAKAGGVRVNAALQCVFGCVYEGAIDGGLVLRASEAMARAGASQISLCDTTGMADPHRIRQLCESVRDALPGRPIVLHLHDTRGLGMVNLLAGYEAGVRMFDVCTGGLGGCPFIRGAAGNVATEDVVHLFESMGIDTGIRWQELAPVVEVLEEKLGRALPGHMTRVLKAVDHHRCG